MIRDFKNTIRNSLVILFALAGLQAVQGQINCDISMNATMPVCAGEEYIFSAPFNDSSEYIWQKDGLVQEDYVNDSVNKVFIIIDNESLITLTVRDTMTQETCTSSLTVTIHPKFTIDFKQLQLTCTNSDTANGNTAKMQAIAKGDMEPDKYHYFWDVKPIQVAPGDSSVAIGLMAYQKYFITVKDNFGCRVKDTAWTVGYPNATLQLHAEPDSVVYVQNPYVTLSYINLTEDSIPVSSHFWDFGDDTPSSDLDEPLHAYTEEGTYIVSLTAFNFQGCDSIYLDTILVKPVNLLIPNVFTPNGDGVNDKFVITEAPPGDEGGTGGQKAGPANGDYKPVNAYYRSTELYIFNRWGRIVYKSTNYQNDWDGGNLPDGVYFYVLKAHGEKSDDVFKGSVTIFGKTK